MLNHLKLTEHLRNNANACIGILEDLGYQNISHITSKNQLRFSREEGTNPTSMRLLLDTLKFNCFSTNEYGNIYSLVMKQKNMNFPEALSYVAKFLGLSVKSLNQKIKYPFSGFYKGLMKEITEPEYSMETYDEAILKDFDSNYNLMFLNDGIDFSTQKEFQVGYDPETLRITVPEYTLDGKLCGIMGRLNDKNCEKGERWLPIIPCSRNLTLYGFHKNYANIQKKDLVVIGESEKFVQQLHSMQCYIGLALCGCDISVIQSKHIKGLMTKKVILALDEGLEEEKIAFQAKKLVVNNAMFKNHVGYIFDRDNLFIPKGSKGSPTDFGKKVFLELCKNHVVWIS